MTRVLVAGATGYLGGFVAREFKRRGDFVRILVRNPGKIGPLVDVADEVVQGQITRPETLEGVCHDIDVVFSSVGITKQRDGLTFQDVDYRGNLNLLECALRGGVKRFIYTSVFRGPALKHLAIVKAHEDFVTAMRASGLEYVVVRPTGFFSDMEEYMGMARKGRAYLFGNGRNRINPIHGADLAVVCADGAVGESREVDVGGPEVLDHRQIAQLAFDALGRTPKISTVPLWAMRAVVSLVKPFNRHQGELLAFVTTAMSEDGVAPIHGTHTLEDHFRAMAS